VEGGALGFGVGEGEGSVIEGGRILMEGGGMKETKILAEKIRAYEATDYRIGHTGADIVLNVGKYSDRVMGLFAENGVSCGGFLTAYNPQGKQQSDAENERSHGELARWLEKLGVVAIEGSGSEEGTEWPTERSYFGLGLGREMAKEMGGYFDQDAIVWVGADGVAELVLLR
jgi:hypothetical protein